jgi:hypothetical protein
MRGMSTPYVRCVRGARRERRMLEYMSHGARRRIFAMGKGERHATHQARHIEGNHRALHQGRKEGGQIAEAICRHRAESGAQVRRKDSEEAQLDIDVTLRGRIDPVAQRVREVVPHRLVRTLLVVFGTHAARQPRFLVLAPEFIRGLEQSRLVKSAER